MAIRGFTEKTQTKSIPSISQVFLYSNFAQYLGPRAWAQSALVSLRELFSADPFVPYFCQNSCGKVLYVKLDWQLFSY